MKGFRSLFNKACLIILMTTIICLGSVNGQDRSIGPELANSITTNWDTEPLLGLPKPSAALGFRYQQNIHQYPKVRLFAGACLWLPRSKPDEVTLLKKDPSFPDASVSSQLSMGALEFHYGLDYSFKKNAEDRSYWYVGIGIGVNGYPFRETITQENYDFVRYELSPKFKQDVYRGVLVVISVNGHVGRQFRVFDKEAYIESYLHIPSVDPIGNPYEMIPRTLMGFRLGMFFELKKLHDQPE